MTTYEDVELVKPEVGEYEGFDHVHWWVGNAKITASWYVSRMGFEEIAYRGLETGSRDVCTHVVRCGRVTFAFSSPLHPEAGEYGQNLADHMKVHGDGVKDVAFTVDDAAGIYAEAMKRGAESVREPEELKDEEGSVIIATVKTYGDTVHTFVQRSGYTGIFLPGYRAVTVADPIAALLPAIPLEFIDHCVGNMPDAGMIPTVEWYERILQFHRFWSVDDKEMSTEFSALRSVVMASYNEKIKMPINEPAEGKRKSQIQEYVEFYNGPGVQHIALNTPDIISSISNLRARGVTFLKVPATYYEALRKRLAEAGMEIAEDLARIEELNILVDFDDKGYLLQLFTSPIQDRPSVFLEVIQRAGCSGFGAGNFKALFESIEREQAERGNL